MRFVISILLLFCAVAAHAADEQIVLPPETETDTRWVLVVNIPEFCVRAYHGYTSPDEIDDLTSPTARFPIAIGLRQFRTPVFEGSILSKQRRPTWFAPDEAWAGELRGQEIPFTSTDNPFRARRPGGGVDGYFVTVSRIGVGFHSTTDERSIGRPASHGCLRMRFAHVKEIMRLPLGTPVSVRYKLFRIERDTQGLLVRGFKDVYGKYSSQQKLAHFSAYMNQFGLSVAMLTPEETASVLSGQSVSLKGLRTSDPAVRISSVSYPGYEKKAPPDQAAAILASALLGLAR